MIKITEDDNIHLEWYEKAKNQTPETIGDFIKELFTKYEHNYGTVCHAIAASAIAGAWAANSDKKQGGITLFQSGSVMWEFIRRWGYSELKTGLKIINYDNLLYPQYENSFNKTIPESTWKCLQKAASEMLAENKNYFVSSPIKQHWESIVDGVVPFGFRIKE